LIELQQVLAETQQQLTVAQHQLTAQTGREQENAVIELRQALAETQQQLAARDGQHGAALRALDEQLQQVRMGAV